jgi:hypothetical protein
MMDRDGRKVMAVCADGKFAMAKFREGGLA